jgi:hypothetical protein
MDELRDLIPPGWRAPSAHYPCAPYKDLPTVFITLDIIEAVRRDPGTRDFDIPRLRRLADGITKGHPIPPIEISSPARDEAYQYRVCNGFHRFYLCKELGFKSIPAVDVTGLSGD